LIAGAAFFNTLEGRTIMKKNIYWLFFVSFVIFVFLSTTTCLGFERQDPKRNYVTSEQDFIYGNHLKIGFVAGTFPIITGIVVDSNKNSHKRTNLYLVLQSSHAVVDPSVLGKFPNVSGTTMVGPIAVSNCARGYFENIFEMDHIDASGNVLLREFYLKKNSEKVEDAIFSSSGIPLTFNIKILDDMIGDDAKCFHLVHRNLFFEDLSKSFGNEFGGDILPASLADPVSALGIAQQLIQSYRKSFCRFDQSEGDDGHGNLGGRH
jgi:hypothetical protein